ncbi:anti-sigma factor domain-containing protein [Rhodoferax saidenbachensis]|uniref:Anti-sigma-K factor RskA n=1 Tax=Rhodoferax saidenbachensis TaxID=1484693 RepID=A0ABU1ZNB6_9BURK|nr:anti-sigma factor [Rhodoferax saidenbachensis]MDR7306385.1 anti-sigma-K factor RskA [Rhodoferax saidenbachensis]
MNLIQHPELLDRLASSYALGTLRGGARRRFETLAREQAPVRAAALIWQSRLASLNELQPQAQPSPAVWTRIDNLVQGEKQSAAQQAVRAQAAAAAAEPAGLTGWLRSLTVWRTATAAGALATIAAVSVGIGMREELGGEIARLQTQLQSAPQIEYVAVLADDKAAASMLVTFDPKAKKLTLQRVGAYQEAGDRSLQLWALPPAGGPKSLGVLGSDKLLRLTAGESDVREVPTLAISLEPKGGVPSETGPTGPVLFKGTLIQKML